MTDDPLERLRKLYCAYCFGTGIMDLVNEDQSREPWPCLYCEAGMRIRESRDAVQNQSAARSNGDGGTNS
jgi:hypothetical protein